ncbi:MAG: PSD1 and planctomycete cytochrome C domain-containing protein [Planctomycetaceae bacterium]
MQNKLPLLRWQFPRQVSCLAILLLLSVCEEGLWAAAPGDVRFNRDVRPILSDHCFSCHGPDANHREADLRLDVREAAVTSRAIVPNQPTESELIARILSDDPEKRMPPESAHKPLSSQQVETLKRWVEQGAEYEPHWAYQLPVKAAVPGGVNAVDFLVRKRLGEIGLKPSPAADRRTLIRRLSFDLTGLPPSPQEVADFIKDSSPDAYAKVVDRLLHCPHYGERMAAQWLDVVRYADTIGYHSDVPRNVWPYRDWVIRSFNENKRFDRFTIEQVAGDLLPDANQETRVGSAFNRLLLTTEEGGAQPKDYEQRMLTDRVRAIGTAWLGQTTGCSQCHDHKFDPITMRDFYSLGAFFADIKELSVGKREEGMLVTTPEQEARLKQFDLAIAEKKTAYAAKEYLLKMGVSIAIDKRAERPITLPELSADSTASEELKELARQVNEILTKPEAEWDAKQLEAVKSYIQQHVDPELEAPRKAVASAESDRNSYYASLPKCIVSISDPQKRTVRILPRGNWMDETGEIVKPALPAFLVPPNHEGRELTRLDLAQWLVSRENPLTARTVMNRMWKQFFGTGLSRVLDDLGAQGEPPVNPELLDWLACEFVDSGWDVQHMVRLIVMSDTYQQASTATKELTAIDPNNRECARQTPFRIDAELVRDNALAISGLLVPKIGGPSVKPYQPDRYWENLNFPTRDWVADTGESLYRRGLYVWWQRTFLHPSLLAFDAPSREECVAERNRSNIPQQALVLLNDPIYVEAARAFAARVMTECSGDTTQRIQYAWQLALQRDPTPREIAIAEKLLTEQRSAYEQAPAAAEELLKTGAAPLPAILDHRELAAWTHVTRVLLNLHETITRP